MQIREMLITSQNRPKVPMEPQYLTIHNTSNTAPAINERNNIQNNYNPQRKASFHWVVDDKEAILCIPENEVAWHTGTSKGNLSSIGMEICEPSDGLGVKSPEWPVIYGNAVLLAADILKRHKWAVDKLRTHKSWSGKECPRLLLPIWDKFVADVKKALGEEGSIMAQKLKVKVNGKILFDKEVTAEDLIKVIAEVYGAKVDTAPGVINIITGK